VDRDRWQRLTSLFDAAVDLDPDSRRALLDRECGSDDELRRELELLIARDRGADALVDAIRSAPVAGRRIGAYRVVRELGVGGMGAVVLAVRDDDAYDRRVAIKMMRGSLGSGPLVERFLAERRILAGLDHPNIARLLDGGTTDTGEPYVVMEHVDGLPLDAFCDRRCLPIRERLELFRSVCAAVQHAHAHLVVHRDLKPANILVAADGEPKLLDFGIAKLIEPSPDGFATPDTATGQRALTPDYASPEQIRGETVSTTTDVYSLGVVLYELLAGRSPYRVGSRRSGEIERAVLEQEAERPSVALFRPGAVPEPGPVAAARGTDPERLRRSLAGDLDTIVLAALRKESARRYPSVEALSEDVRRHLDGLPIAARPSTVGYQLGKFVRRHRPGVAATLAIALLFGGLVGFHTWRLARARDVAERERRVAERTTEFLVELFEEPDPERNRGRETTARELLDRGAIRIGDELGDDPLLRARLLHTLGNTYRGLADHARSEQLLREAIAVRRETLGTADRATLAALDDLAFAVLEQDRYEEAETIAREALDAARRELGADDEVTLDLTSTLGVALRRRGRYDEAAAIGEQALAGYLRVLGEEHGDTLWAMNNLAIAYKELRRLPEARDLYERALAVRRRIDGDDSPATLAIMINVSNVYRRMDGSDRAAEILERALEHLPRVLGPTHPHTLVARNNLGMAYLNLGRTRDAERLYLALLEDARRELGPGSSTAVSAMRNLAVTYGELDRHEDAAALLAEIVDRSRSLYGDLHRETLGALYDLACARVAVGRSADAWAPLGEAVDGSADHRGRLAADPCWTAVREDPAFRAIVARAAAQEAPVTPGPVAPAATRARSAGRDAR
jgi:serine/threonine-protein kinase